MKKFYSCILFFACFVIVFAVFGFSSNSNAQSIQDYEQKIKDLDNEKKKLQEKEAENNEDKQSVENKMNENLADQDSVKRQMETIESKLAETESEISSTEAKLTETNEKINELKEEIENLKAEIKELEERIKKRDKLLKDRLRSLQESGGKVPYISVILGSQSFSELISRSSAVNSIMDQDKTIIEEHFADKRALHQKEKDVVAKKDEVEKQKKEEEAQKQNLVKLKSTLDDQKAEKKKLQKKLEKEYGEMEEYNLSLAEENKIIANQASSLEKAKQLAQNEIAKIEQEQKATAAQSSNSGSGNVTGGSQSGSAIFSWPASGRLSSGFGSRPSPGGIGSTTHNGIDISAPKGTAVTAPASGVVNLVNTGCVEGNYSCGGGYGNYIIITHVIDGKHYDTLYGHLSSVNVSNGQTVSKGQTIAGVGHTGSSTGPHLHFEVHPGGYKNPVNPMQFLP